MATIKAPVDEIERFAAYHLDFGAHRVFLYLDAPDAGALERLSRHPRLRVTACDAQYWARRGRRPAKHQVRQTRNATRAYRRQADVDWLAHIDVDEFLCPERSIGEVLGALPDGVNCLRIRPMELLAGGDGACKDFVPAGPGRASTVDAIYPRYGKHVTGGFLSHVAGKLFVRTGIVGLEYRIHNVYADGIENPGQRETDALRLCHAHARDWSAWRAALDFRRGQGAYRADLAPARGGRTLNQTLAAIEAAEGEAGLRAFFDEICADSPGLRARLQAHGLLRHVDLDLAVRHARHFPPND